jgi:hypothetical protein
MNIQGKDYKVEVTLGALRLFCRVSGKTNIGLQKIEAILENITIDELDRLLWCALKVCNDFPHSLEELQEELDQNPALVDAFQNVLQDGTPEPSDAEGEN